MKNKLKHPFALIFILLITTVVGNAQNPLTPYDYINRDSMEYSTDPGTYYLRTLSNHIDHNVDGESGVNKSAARSLSYWIGSPTTQYPSTL